MIKFFTDLNTRSWLRFWMWYNVATSLVNCLIYSFTYDYSGWWAIASAAAAALCWLMLRDYEND